MPEAQRPNNFRSRSAGAFSRNLHSVDVYILVFLAAPQGRAAGNCQATNFSPRPLFSDGLAAITPLLWLLFVLDLVGFYFLAGWNPTVLASANGLGQREALEQPAAAE